MPRLHECRNNKVYKMQAQEQYLRLPGVRLRGSVTVVDIGQVAITLNVMPESPDSDINHIKDEIKKRADVKEIRENPIAFGLVSLKVLLILPDSAGGTDKIEKMISEIKGVASVETEDITLI